MSQPPPPGSPPQPPYGDPHGSFSSLPPPQPPAAAGEEWTVGQAAIGVLAVFLIFNLGVVALVPLTGTSGLDFTLPAQAILGASLVAVAAWFATQRHSDRPALETLGIRRPTPGWVGLTFASFLGFLAFALVLTAIGAEREQEDIANELGFDQGVAAAVAVGFLIVVVAPVTEEIFFRGFFFAALRERLGFVVAAVISGIVFGAIHLNTSNLLAGFQLAVLGVLLAWLYERSGSTIPCIALHGLNNALAFIALTAS